MEKKNAPVVIKAKEVIEYDKTIESQLQRRGTFVARGNKSDFYTESG